MRRQVDGKTLYDEAQGAHGSAGGSVCFVGGPKRNRTLFRMPFVEIEDGGGRLYGIRMRPEPIRVRQDLVGKLPGWRYLRDEDAPPDPSRELSTDNEQANEMPPETMAELREAGLLP